MKTERMIEPERWRQIEEVFHEALDRQPSERAAFLEQACAADEALRQEVESLLSNEATAENFIEAPALEIAARGLAADHAPSLAGESIGRYQILALLGEGGMGQVYLARDTTLNRRVALKVLPVEFTRNADRVRRFEREAQAASALNHPNILTIHEVGQYNGLHFIISEFIEGRTLRQQMKETRIAVPAVIDLAMQTASALKVAHAAGIIHCDIKPENIMVRQDGLVKVLDFGIAKLATEGRGDWATGGQGDVETGGRGEEEPFIAPSPRPSVAPSLPCPSLTTTGMIIGTASYMSPEQARGQPLDARTDLFSLGVVLYELVTRQRLFEGETRAEALHSLLSPHELPQLGAKLDEAPKDLARIIGKALRKDRDERYASAGEMLDDLRALRHQLETRASRRLMKTIALAAALAVVAMFIAVWLSLSEEWEPRRVRDGHTAAARQAVFSPDGKLLVSVGEDKQVIVWDFARRERKATFTDHTDIVPSVAFSPDGKWFVTGSHDKTVIVWDAVGLKKVKVLTGHPGKVNAVAFSPDGRLLASASEGTTAPGAPDQRTILWDVGRWEKVRELPVGFAWGQLLFTPDGRWLLFHDRRYWDVATGQPVAGYPEEVACCGNWATISPDGTRLVSVGSGGNVEFSDLIRRKHLGQYFVHQDNGRAVAFSPDGRLLASGAEDIVLWDATTLTKLSRLKYPAIVWNVAFSPDGRWLVSTHGDGAILLWEVTEREQAANFNEHSAPVRAVAFSPDGKHLASASEDRSVIIWDVERGQKEAVLAGHTTRVAGVAFSPDGSWVASCDQGATLIRWDATRRQPQWVVKDVSGDTCLVVSPDGRWVATAHGVYESTAGRQIVNAYTSTNNAAWGGIYGAAFSTDGRRLVWVTDFGHILLWDTEKWQLIAHHQLSNTHLISVSFSRDGKWLVTGEDEKTVRLWSVEPLRPIDVIGRHDARIKSVAFSPDGQQVASAGDDKTINLWDVRWRRLITRIGTHTAPVVSIAFSPDGKRLVAGEHDNTVTLYTRRRTLWGWRLE